MESAARFTPFHVSFHAIFGPRDRARIVFDCRTANDPATINKESTNENNTDVDRWVDARRLQINGKPCS
jgi:hypothetical protein